MPPPNAALVALLPVVLLVLQATLSVPQLVRLVRAQHGGVPLTGEALSLVAGSGWVVWAVMVGDVAIGVSGLLAIVGFGPSTWILLRAGRPWRSAAWLGATLVVGALTGWLLGGVVLLATVLTGFAAVQYGAYLLEAVRCRDWSGFSPTSGALRVVYGAGWILHGTWTGNVFVVVWGCMVVTTFVVTLAVALTWRARTRPVLAA